MSGPLIKRAHWVDYAKAIGIILVVYGHVARGLVKAGIFANDDLFKTLDSVIYSFHMPLFFFLSGLFFFDSLRARGKFGLIKSKINTILNPYVIWSLLQGFIEVALSNYTNGDVTLFQVLSFAWEPRAQFWFLYALFLVFVFSAFVYDFFGEKFIFPLFVAFAIAYLLKYNFPPVEIANFIIENTVFFALGILFEKLVNLFENRAEIFAIIFGTSFLILQYHFHVDLDWTYQLGGAIGLVLAIVSIFFIVALSIWLSKFEIKTLLYIGSSSMTIYLLHILAGSGIRISLKNLFSITSPAIHLILGVLMGIYLPLVFKALLNQSRLAFVLKLSQAKH